MTELGSDSPKNIQWKRLLRNQGFRITAPREAVIDTIAASQRALDAAQIFKLARQNCSSLGLVSVYRTLEILEKYKLVQRVHQSENCQAYIAGFEGHQHLLICTGCGKTIFFDGDDMEFLFDRVAEESGYQIKDHWLQLFGLCEDCKKAQEG